MESDEAEIEWLNYWGGFFGDNTNRSKTIESAYGMIVIQMDEYLYTISLGREHSYANTFADMDFGFDIAEIIHDESAIDIKSVKFFKQSKNKSLTQYNRNSFVTTEIGESHELLVSKIKIHKKYSNFTLFKYEDKMKFGSNVKIETNSLTEEKTGSLPRMNILKNNVDR